MGEVVGRCFLCQRAVGKGERRVVEVRRQGGDVTRELACWRCWLHVMAPKWVSVIARGEAVEARPSSVLMGELVE